MIFHNKKKIQEGDRPQLTTFSSPTQTTPTIHRPQGPIPSWPAPLHAHVMGLGLITTTHQLQHAYS